MRRPGSRRLAFVTLMGIVALGCDSGSPTENQAISVSLSQHAVTIGQGEVKTITVTVERRNFDGAVSLAITGAPVGVAVELTADTLTGGRTSTLQISTTGAAVPGTSTMLVKAIASGVAEQSSAFSLTVTTTGSYTLSMLRPTVTVAQGGAGSVDVLIGRSGGFAGNVTFAVAGLPSGISVTVVPEATSGNVAGLRLTASASVIPGAYNMTVTGTAPGMSVHVATVLLLVIAPPTTANVTFEFCGFYAPIWVAYQNEGYEWQRAQGAGPSYTFAVTERVGVAMVFQYGSAFEVVIHYGTRSEHADVVRPRVCWGSKSLTGSFVGLEGGQVAIASIGGATGWARSTSPTFMMRNVPTGARDLVAARGLAGGFDTPEGPQALTPDRLVIRRSLDLPYGDAIPALDFTSAEAFPPATTTLNITGFAAGEAGYVANALVTLNSTFGRLYSSTGTAATRTLYSTPVERLGAGDLHSLRVIASSTNLLLRGYSAYFAGAEDRVDALGPNVGIPAVTTLAMSPYARLRARLTAQPEYPGEVDIIFGGLYNASRNVHVCVTAGYLGGTPAAWDVVVPDLTGAPDFQAAWMPGEGQVEYYEATAYSRAFTLLSDAFPLLRPPRAGDIIRYSDRAGVIGQAGLQATRIQPLTRPNVP